MGKLFWWLCNCVYYLVNGLFMWSVQSLIFLWILLQQIPKLVYQETAGGSKAHTSQASQKLSRESIEKLFNIFSPENISSSSLQKDYNSDRNSGQSGAFEFSRFIDLSPAEVSFLATCSFMERLLFSIMRSDRQYLDEIFDLLMESDDDIQYAHIGKEKVRAVTRMLLLPSRSEKSVLRQSFATGPMDAPFEALIMPYQDRLLSDIKLVHSVYSFIPRTRAPPVSRNLYFSLYHRHIHTDKCVYVVLITCHWDRLGMLLAQINVRCSDRNFAYKMAEEWHHPWLKRLLTGFARTSDCNGPRKPTGTHPLIQEIDAELPIIQPALQLTYKVFGSCPPMQPFDPAKMLTVRSFSLPPVLITGPTYKVDFCMTSCTYSRILGSFKRLIYY